MSDKIVFGIVSYKNAVAGVHLNSVQEGETGSTAEAVNEDGEVEQIDVHSKKRTVQAQGNIVSGADLSALTVGATVTFGGRSYRITSISKTEAANAHGTFSLNGEAPITSGGQVGN